MPKASSSKSHSNGTTGRQKSAAKSAKLASLSSLQDLATDTVHNNLRAPKTTKNYDSAVAYMQNWLKAVDLHDGDVKVINDQMFKLGRASHPVSECEIRDAFSDQPSRVSPYVLSMFLVLKCVKEKLGKETMWRYFSAIKAFWEASDGDTYRGAWRWNSELQRYEGNPCETGIVKDQLKAIQHLKGGESTEDDGPVRKHAVAMSYNYLEQLQNDSKARTPKYDNLRPETDHVVRAKIAEELSMRAFLSLGWLLWLRNFETLKIRFKHVSLLNVPGQKPMFVIHIVDRKGWQKKADKNGTRGSKQSTLDSENLSPNVYHIPDLPELDAANVFRHLQEWLAFLEHQFYRRPLEPEDCLFPTINANGIISDSRDPVTHQKISELLKEWTTRSGLESKLGGGVFTTHSLRRGGAQHWFLHSDVRWELDRIRWWGGWAKGESHDVLIRYLLNELASYEESHATALVGFSDRQAEPTASEQAAEGRRVASDTIIPTSFIDSLMACIADKMESVTLAVQHETASLRSDFYTAFGGVRELFLHSGYASDCLPKPHGAGFLSGWAEVHTSAATQGLASARFQPYSRPAAAFAEPTFSRFRVQPAPPPTPHSTTPEPWQVPAMMQLPAMQYLGPPPGAIILKLPLVHDGKKDGSRSLSDILHQWTHGWPDRGIIPLSRWPREWLTGKNKKIYASLHNQRQVIALEYLNRYSGNDVRFKADYDVWTKGHTALYNAIQAARRVRGDLKPRCSKNGTPGQRAAREADESSGEDEDM